MRDYLNELAESGDQRKAEDPVWVARQAMKPQLIKRFYKEVSTSAAKGEGHLVLLDGKSLKTPGKREVKLLTEGIAKRVAAEWDAQQTEINPVSMPFTRLANTAIDGVADDPQVVLEDVLKYAGTDLLCYRMETPEGLATIQQEKWDPILDGVEARLAHQFETTTGISHVPQSKAAIASLGEALRPYSGPFEITCLHTLCSLSGSALVAFALAEEQLGVDEAWKAAHVEEDWNIAQWGDDEEAMERRVVREQNFRAAHEMLLALKHAERP